VPTMQFQEVMVLAVTSFLFSAAVLLPFVLIFIQLVYSYKYG
jgi:hypothetical protein